jgi:hypothetical protein
MSTLCSGPQFFTASFQGANGTSGPVNISVPGTKVGDLLMAFSAPGLGTGAGPGAYFYATVQTDDTVWQTWGGDATAYTFKVVLMRFI